MIPCLAGARLEKIHAPDPDCVCLSFYAQRRKLHLLLRHGRRGAFLCELRERPAAPSTPSSRIMLLRKYVQGRRVHSCVAHWLQRRLDLFFGGASGEGAPPWWLCLDLRTGPRLESRVDAPTDASWPLPEALPLALETWRDWPVLTPALRRTLPLLEEGERRALLTDLAGGGGDVFVYGQGDELECVAWPLATAQRAGRDERVFEDVLAAASLVGAARIRNIPELAEREARERRARRETRRLQRLLDKLEAEELRLRELAAAQRAGLALRAQLWRYPPDYRCGELTLDSPDGPVLIRPDPRHSLREHMERLFHSAGRGRRGLALLEQRRADLRERLARASDSSALEPEAASGAREEQPVRGPAGLPANVQAFAGSDGVTILRGRDAGGNWALLRLARPYDLWMHVEGGPGAHVLVRRGQGQELPPRVLHEAAQLALVKSWQRGSARAGVVCAQARHVRPVRGGKPGAVRVDKVECVLDARSDPDIELRLARL